MEANGSEGKEFLPGYETVDKFTQSNLRKILGVTKVSNDLPGEKRADYDYYSTFPEFRKRMATQTKNLRDMLKSQLSFQGIKSGVNTSDIENLVDMLTDANDTILERINLSLDEASGVKKDVNPMLLEVSEKNINRVAGSWNNFDRRKKKGQTNEVKLLAAKNVIRPQVKFKKFIDNTTKPFMPRLTDKPHNKKPLSILVEYDDSNLEFYSHPYQFEIERFTPKDFMVENCEARMPKSVDVTELVMVETEEQLSDMIKYLKQYQAIAVDLEGHTYRTYQGITCLIQISTDTRDYLVDPFNIWEQMTNLNEIFADPNIVKVLHGCQQDVVWLQRDFSVYLVNIFDTHQAGKILNFPRLSLAWLLETYCKVYADKQYQLADWRIRPIPEVMVYYARQDTRYLIYLYHKLKGELLMKGNEHKNLLHQVYQQSNIICSNRYEKPIVTDVSHESLLKKSKSVFNNRQMFALQELYSWRDGKGRLEDESVHYVLPNHMLLKICSELPREMQGILACCNPIPPIVKQNLQEIHMVILKARNKALQAVDLELLASKADESDDTRGQAGQDFNENPLKCPLDLYGMDFGIGLPTLIDVKSGKQSKFKPSVNIPNLKTTSQLVVFTSKNQQPKQKVNNKVKKFISPFERFKLLVPYLEKLKIAEQAAAKTTEAETNDNTKPNTEEVNGKEKDKNSEDVNLESIMKHFQKLTDMTPKPKKAKEDEEEGEVDEMIVDGADKVTIDDQDDDIVRPIRSAHKKGDKSEQRKKTEEDINKDVEKRKLQIENKLVQEEIAKKKKKRKSTASSAEDTPSKVPKKELKSVDDEKNKEESFDYSAVNVQSLFGGATPNKPTSDFHPYKGKKFGKPKQKQKDIQKMKRRKY